MNNDETTILIELISSKICHDIISPVGAIANGIEILEEMGADDDVTSLISFSTEQANAKLKLLRMAYGMSGSDTNIKIEDIHKTFGNFIYGDNRIAQSWDSMLNIGFEHAKGFPKLLLCCLIMVSESLPKGGDISISVDGENTIVITGKGDNAGFKEGYIDSLENKISIADLTPKLIHPYISGIFSKKYNFEISYNDDLSNIISLRLKQSSVHS